jgi:hypothetical protein
MARKKAAAPASRTRSVKKKCRRGPNGVFCNVNKDGTKNKGWKAARARS